MSMLNNRVADGLLSPDDAVANRWGFTNIPHLLANEPVPYVEVEDDSSATYPLEENSEKIDEEIQSMMDIQSPDILPYQDTKQVSRRSSYSSRRSSSMWSMKSVLTAITAPSSQRQSWTGSVKAISTSSMQDPPSKPRQLPYEVLVCIIQHLRTLHEGPKSSTCSSCFNRDAFNLALVDRAWDKAIKNELYRCIHIDVPNHSSRRLFSKSSNPLKLLRRTLKDHGVLAKAVRGLRIWNTQSVLDEHMQDQIASVIMACPNLQLYTGSQAFYHHKISRLHYALSTRERLKSHLWVVGASNGSYQDSALDQTNQFINFHTSWYYLTTLALHCQRGALFQPEIFPSLTKILPALENLSISGFSEESFDDNSLLSLKPLRALRLAALPGVTDRGLAQFSNSEAARSLRSLTLIGLSILSLYTISRLLSNLKLAKFTFTHFRSLTIPAEDLILQPLLASRTLTNLHWEVPLSGSQLSLSTSHLATSIQHHGFPSLQHLRCPIDTNAGAIQALCKPQALPNNLPLLPNCQIAGSTLRAARLRSLARIVATSKGEMTSAACVKIQITDPDGLVHHLMQATWLGYVGHDRNIEYVLDSDVGPWEHRKTLAEEGDLLGEVGTSAGTAGTGCRGFGSRKHVQRPRWRGTNIQCLF